jgi:GPN-loop GTPase
MTPWYGQAVVGPPGSGKTTYCDGMQQYLRLLGRDGWVINLDPANERAISQSDLQKSINISSRNEDTESLENVSYDSSNNIPAGKSSRNATNNHDSNDAHTEDENDTLPYETLFDVCQEVINLSSVMEKAQLGPNGGLIYCMEYIEAHADEILSQIQSRLTPNMYLLLDLPGQVELYTHSTCVQRLLHRMVRQWDLRLTVVQLMDAQFCTDAAKFIAAALLGTTTMLRLELPTINVLSKVDMLTNASLPLTSSSATPASRWNELPMPLEFYTDCQDLTRLLPFVQSTAWAMPADDDRAWQYVEDAEYRKAVQRRKQSRLSRKQARLHAAYAEVVQDFGLLSFMPLDITQAESVGRVLARIDQSNGYVWKPTSTNSTAEDQAASLFQCAIQADNGYDSIADIQERLNPIDSHLSELERKL